MKLIYLAHPLSAKRHDGSVDHLGILKNIEQARRWFKWACDHYPDYAFNATWIMNCEVYNDANSEERRQGMERNNAHIQRCDALWLLGPKVSEGMLEEAAFAWQKCIPVYDLTSEGLDPLKTPRMPPEDMMLWKPGGLTEQVLGL
jgi:hypothetical protein